MTMSVLVKRSMPDARSTPFSSTEGRIGGGTNDCESAAWLQRRLDKTATSVLALAEGSRTISYSPLMDVDAGGCYPLRAIVSYGPPAALSSISVSAARAEAHSSWNENPRRVSPDFSPGDCNAWAEHITPIDCRICSIPAVHAWIRNPRASYRAISFCGARMVCLPTVPSGLGTGLLRHSALAVSANSATASTAPVIAHERQPPLPLPSNFVTMTHPSLRLPVTIRAHLEQTLIALGPPLGLAVGRV